VVIVLSGSGYNSLIPITNSLSYFTTRGCTQESNETEYASSYYYGNTQVYVCPELPGSYTFSISGDSWTSSILSAAYVFPTANTSSTTFTESGLPANATWEVAYDGITIIRNSTVNDSITFLPETGGSYLYNVSTVQVKVVSILLLRTQAWTRRAPPSRSSSARA
ncbi:hypothetical protein B2A_12562, partial [mine drainage metagenome]